MNKAARWFVIKIRIGYWKASNKKSLRIKILYSDNFLRWKMKILLLMLLCAGIVTAQNDPEVKMNEAFKNAKKGVYYALSNIPDKKNSWTKELIDKDKLVAKVKISREVAGVEIESEGYHDTYEIKITLYRSYESLLKDGTIKYIPGDD
jgi:hypothetical protein